MPQNLSHPLSNRWESRRVKPSRRRPSLTLLLCLLGGIPGLAAAQSTPSPQLRSQSVLVLDSQSGSVIYSRQAERVAPIASITKLMTALVVLDADLPLEEELTITQADRSRTLNLPSRLAVGTRLTRRELLQLALMSSENRAAQALGRNYPGGEAAFLKKMNEKAREIGMQHARFEDPTGLSDHNVASPTDLAKLVIAANRNELVRTYSTMASRVVLVGRQPQEFRNTNPLVRDPAWQVSVQKTGHIAAAGQCLVMQAAIDGRQVVMVLLNSVGKYTRVADARRMRQWLAKWLGVAAPAAI
jgi:serine-type D-Ala-D-Ala endopeptidase (penicillin-binding protein 7)